MWRTTLKSINAHKRRLIATCSAVLLGVAFLSGTLVLGDTMNEGFGDMFTEANAGIDAEVRSSVEVGEGDFAERGLVDRSLVDEIAALDGVRAVAPNIEGQGRIVGADGDPIGGNGPPTIAGNWVTDETLNPYEIAEGRAPEAAGEVVIDRAAAESGDLAVGDTTEIRTPDPIEVDIVGVATFGDADSQGPLTYAAFTQDYAEQVLLAEPGGVDSISVSAEPGVSEAELVSRIDAALPDGTEALTGAALTAEQETEIQEDFLSFFETFMLVFAGIALVVATFSIYNTFSILVAQRTRESALMRALGASRGQILRSVTVEAVVVGLVASAGGIVAGLGLASGLLALMDTMGMSMPGSALVLGTGTIVTAVLVGVVVTLLASLVPAIKASRIAPLAALRDTAVDRSGASWFRAVAGVLVMVAGVVAAVAGATGGTMSLTGLGALGTLVGMVMLGPVVARPAAGALGAPQAARPGLSGTLARRNSMRNPRRTAGTAAALMVGVAVVSLFTVTAASIKQSINDTVDGQFAGDLVVMSDGFGMGGLPTDLADAVADMPEVATVAAGGNGAVQVDGEDELAATVDPVAIGAVMDLGVSAGSLDDVGPGQVAMSEGYAEDRGLSLGDPVPVTYPDGVTEDLTVGAVYGEDDLMGDLMIHEDAWTPHTAQPEHFVAMVDLADGVSDADGELAVQAVADRYGSPDVQTAAEYTDSVAGQVDQMLTIVYVMLLLAIIIALMGIANTMSLSIHERTRELGLLRAVGQTRRQLRAMVRGEAFTVALFGTVGGVGLGLFLGWAVVDSLADEGFTAFAIPVGQLAVILALGALVGVIAAVRPARRAARLDVLEAIATE